jgi:GNAT superfamily N-acetyltransferase
VRFFLDGMHVMITKARTDDASEILRVINISNRESYRNVIPKAFFRDPFLSLEQLIESFTELTFFVFRRGDTILGVAALQVERMMCGRISRLYVLPEVQRQGIGTALVRHVEREAVSLGLQRLRLRVGESADWAVQFYRGLGYEAVDRLNRPAGYVLDMEKRLQIEGG